MGLTAELRTKLTFRYTGSADFGGQVYSPSPPLERIIALTSGTGANQADLVFADRRTLGASATEDLDLAGVLTDAFGAVITMAEVVAIYVEAAAANTNDVVIGAATQPIPLFGGTTPTFAVKPGGFFFVAAPNAAGLCAVGAGATDDLKVTNSAGSTSVTYDVVIIGRSA